MFRTSIPCTLLILTSCGPGGATGSPKPLPEAVCTDADLDGYGSGCASGPDCDDSNDLTYQLLTGYADADGDGRGTGAAARICSGVTLPRGYADDANDCDDTDDMQWNACAGCADNDGDTYGAGCAAGPDCDDSDPDLFQNLVGYVDQDADGQGAGAMVTVCSSAALAAGYADDNLDCNDNNAELWNTCGGTVTIASFAAAPTRITEGIDTAILWTWTFTGSVLPAPTCTMDNGIGEQISGATSWVNLLSATTYTLTCSNENGSDSATTTINPLPPAAAEIVHFDSFDYVVDRDVANNTPTGPNVFLSHGWSHVKDMRISYPGAGGYLYTVDAIPGYDGVLPGSSGRVLALESDITTKQEQVQQGQSDFYLQYGDGNSGDIPANVWFQFWIYINDTEAQPSRFSRNAKFLYPTSTGYPSNSYPWLVSFSTAQHELGGGVTGDLGYGSSSAFSTRPPGADYADASEYPTNRDKLGSNLSGTSGAHAPNIWYLTRIHIDTSGPQGVYEIWRRPMGSQVWEKTTEWIGGTTTSFSWPTSAMARTGSRLLRMPTTWGRPNDLERSFDAWVYMADFTIATAASALPAYTEY